MPNPRTRDDEARERGFVNADDMEAQAAALEEDHLAETWAKEEGGAPTPMDMWRRLTGMPDTRPLTIAEAAKRENVHPRTIRRKLPALVAMETPGAYKMGRAWRIVPAALDALHQVPAAPPEREDAPRRPKRRTGTKKKPQGGGSTRWEV